LDLPELRRRVPGAALLLVGGGPHRPALQRLAERAGVADEVVFTGSVPGPDLPAHYAAGDVFAIGGITEENIEELMPWRDRISGIAGIRIFQEAADAAAVAARITAW